MIVIDMQNDFFQSGHLAQSRERLTKNINRLIRMFREKGDPIIWVRQELEPDLSDSFLAQRKERIFVTIKGTSGVEVLQELDCRPEDFEVIKKRYSCFYETTLDELLDRLNPSKIVLAGINTHACIRMAAIDAYQRDHEVVVVADCVLSNQLEHHQITLDYMDGHICQVVVLEELRL